MSSDDDRLQQLEQRLARLEDIDSIKRLKARYFRYLDLHWWEELRALFTDDAVFEIEEATAKPGSPDAFIQSATKHLSSAMPVHHGHMPEIELIDDSNARGIWAMYDLV